MATCRTSFLQKLCRRFLLGKKLFICSLAVLFLSSLAGAQNRLLQYEAFAGYSHLGFQTTNLGFGNWTQMNGWDFALSIPHVVKGLGVAADVSGNYATALEQYSYAIGPQYRFQFRKFRFIARALYGKAQTRVREPGSTFIEPSNRNRNLEFGWAVDRRINERFSIRAFQADFMMSSAFGGHQNNIRVSSGLIYRFGKH